MFVLIRKISLILGLILLSSCNSNDLKRFFSNEYGFEISYPSHWVVPKENHLNREFFVKDVRRDNYPVDTNFEILVTEFSFENLNTHKTYYIDFITNKSVFSNVKFIYVEDKVFKGFESKEYLVSATFGNYDVKWKTIFFEKEEMLYQLTTTSSKKEYKDYEEINNKIFDSFEWL